MFWSKFIDNVKSKWVKYETQNKKLCAQFSCYSLVPVYSCDRQEDRFSLVASPLASSIHLWRNWPCFVISVRVGCISEVL